MPFDASLVGTELGRVRVVCDARRLMAYAAGVPAEAGELFDTEAGLVVHPVFAVSPEWEVLIAPHAVAAALTSDERRRGVHAAHDLVVVRPVRVGDVLDVTGRLVGVGRTRAGAVQRVAFSATDADGAPVWHTLMTSVFRGVDLVGEPADADADADVDWPPVSAGSAGSAGVVVDAGAESVVPLVSVVSPVGVADAHAYSECAQIWNPIHTDVAVARAAGLPGPILHGTATMARAVSVAVATAGRSHGDVRRVRARFTGMVASGSAMTIDVLAVSPDGVAVTVRDEDGRSVLAEGWVGF